MARKPKFKRKPNLKDFTGQKIGCLIVLKFVRGSTRGNVWLLKCSICGENRELETNRFSAWRKGYFQSCGCRHYQRGPTHPLFKGEGEMPASFWCRMRGAAKSRGKEFSITMRQAYAILKAQDFKCALSGEIIGFGVGFRSNETTASMDRINCKIGYTSTNIQWVHKDLNRMKWSCSNEEFIRLCRAVVKTHGKR